MEANFASRKTPLLVKLPFEYLSQKIVPPLKLILICPGFGILLTKVNKRISHIIGALLSNSGFWIPRISFGPEPNLAGLNSFLTVKSQTNLVNVYLLFTRKSMFKMVGLLGNLAPISELCSHWLTWCTYYTADIVTGLGGTSNAWNRIGYQCRCQAINPLLPSIVVGKVLVSVSVTAWTRSELIWVKE